MKEELNLYIKSIKMDEKNIKLKNNASFITIIAELIKVILCLTYISKLDKIIVYTILIYAVISVLLALYILNTDNYKKISSYILLDLSTLIFLLSNIISGVMMEKIIWKADKKIIKKLIKEDKKIKPLTNKLYHEKKVYLYLFVSIIIAYQYLQINSIIFYILVLLSLISFFIKDIKISIKEYKENYKSYIAFSLRTFFTFVFISACLFIIINAITREIPTNEEVLNQNQIETLVLGVFYAPIAEELLFRGCLRKLIKNDILFIFISGVSFGAWHVLGYNQSLIQYLYILPYSVIGIGLSYMYAKTNNLTTNMSMHALNNLIACIPI